jgi:hypothetical protein
VDGCVHGFDYKVHLVVTAYFPSFSSSPTLRPIFQGLKVGGRIKEGNIVLDGAY